MFRRLPVHAKLELTHKSLSASTAKQSCTKNTEGTTDKNACHSWPGTRASFGSHGEISSKGQASNAAASQPYKGAKKLSCESVVPTGIASSLPCADLQEHARLAPASVRMSVRATKTSRQHLKPACVCKSGPQLLVEGDDNCQCMVLHAITHREPA